MKRLCCLIVFALSVHASSAFAVFYSGGYQWDWYLDWTVRPASDFGTTNGNPGPDGQGNPVYSFEYIRGLTASNWLGSSSPWYTHTTGQMVWDDSWYGQPAGHWVYANNTLPNATRHGTTFTSSGASVRRWINPTGESIYVDYEMGPGVSGCNSAYIRFCTAPDMMALAICLDHGSGPAGIDLLYSTTFSTPPGYTSDQVVYFGAISLYDILVQPGESIFITTVGYAGPYIDTVFAPTITLVSGPVAPGEALLCVIETIGSIDPDSFTNRNSGDTLINKLEAIIALIEAEMYQDALMKLQHDILPRTDGCALRGEPDKNDWIVTCEDQQKVYPAVLQVIELVEASL